MTDDPTDPQRSRILEEKLDRVVAELRQIRYLMWFLTFVGAAAAVSMLWQLLPYVFWFAVFVAAVAGLWFLASKAAQIPFVRRWRSRTSAVSTSDRDGH